MEIIVCIKQVPDTATQIKIASDGKDIDDIDVKFVVNYYDELGVEEAIRLKESYGGQVTVITIGPTRAREALVACLAMGADNAIHIKDTNPDCYVAAKVLANVIGNLKFDLIICGKQAVDDDFSAVSAGLAQMLNIPQISLVTQVVEVLQDKIIVKHDVEGAKEIIESTLPALITTQRGLTEPRYIPLPKIIMAKKEQIQEISFDSLALSPKLKIENLELPPPKPPGKILTGDPQEMVKEMVKLLQDEAKVI
jgi:electron transfer flavoprotein beta subunit